MGWFKSATIIGVALFIVSTTIPGTNGTWNDPNSDQFHIQTDEGNERYFRYQTHNGQYRKEKRLEDGTVIGSYGWIDSDGMLRLRDYIADNEGYRILRTKNVYVGKNRPISQAIKAAKKVPSSGGILTKTNAAVAPPASVQPTAYSPSTAQYLPPTYLPAAAAPTSAASYPYSPVVQISHHASPESPSSVYSTTSSPLANSYPTFQSPASSTESPLGGTQPPIVPSTYSPHSYSPSTTPATIYISPKATPSTIYLPSSTPAPDYYQPSSTPAPEYYQPSSTPAPNYYQPSSTPAPDYYQPSSTPAPDYYQPSSTPAPDYYQPSSTPAPDYYQPSSNPTPGYYLPPSKTSQTYYSTPSTAYLPQEVVPATAAPQLNSNSLEYSGAPQYEHYNDNYNPYRFQNGPTYPITKLGQSYTGQNNNIGNGYDQQYEKYDGVSVTNDGFRYYIPRAYHEEQQSPTSDTKSGSFGYIDPFGIRRVIYYNAGPGGFKHRKNNRYVGFDATPYDPRPY